MKFDLETSISAFPADLLPAGRLITPESGDEPLFWLATDPGHADICAKLRAEHPRSGLWPLVLHGGYRREFMRPWLDGSVYPTAMYSPGSRDLESLLRRMWESHAGFPDDDQPDDVPSSPPWPGLAAPGDAQGSPDHFADRYARTLLDDSARLGLVVARRSADALTAIGWFGPNNYHETASISAVVRSWEDRFGARVVGLGLDSLELSVSAPPESSEQALLLAAEHLAICPDNLWNGTESLPSYAKEELLGEHSWKFWWD